MNKIEIPDVPDEILQLIDFIKRNGIIVEQEQLKHGFPYKIIDSSTPAHMVQTFLTAEVTDFPINNPTNTNESTEYIFKKSQQDWIVNHAKEFRLLWYFGNCEIATLPTIPATVAEFIKDVKESLIEVLDNVDVIDVLISDELFNMFDPHSIVKAWIKQHADEFVIAFDFGYNEEVVASTTRHLSTELASHIH